LVFLQDWKQFVSIGNNNSIVLKSNAGTPLGTIAGPNDFKLLINDLLYDINSAKYVDDITISSISTDPNEIVHYSQQRITHDAHGLSAMACIVMQRKQKKCYFILEQKLT